MFDPALVVTWTAVALTGGPDPSAALLTALATRIQQQLGVEALRPLRAAPDDPAVRSHLQARIERAAFYDPAFTRDLTRLQQEIDEQKIFDRFHRPATGPVRPGLPDGPAAVHDTAGSGFEPAWVPHHVARNPWYSRALITVGTLTSVTCLLHLTVLMWRAPGTPLPHLPDARQTFFALCAGLVLLAGGVATSHPVRRR